MSDSTGKAGVIVAPDGADAMEKLTHAVLDDLLYNIVYDILLKVHRDEKMARANTAAIRVEKLATDATDSTLDTQPDIRIETDAAIYDEGKTTLKGNPLETTKDVLCPRCHLPRLLYPTEGAGAREPDPNTVYCKKQPFIRKEGFDIYGQTWVAPGPGRGKKKKKVDDNGNPLPAANEPRPAHVLSYPSATCVKCKRCILVTRLNNHMGGCIGNSGRNASRAAAQKLSGNGNNDSTPPASQKGTPLPGSRAASPKKRDGDEFDKDHGANGHHGSRDDVATSAAAAAAVADLVGVAKNGKPPKKKKKTDAASAAGPSTALSTAAAPLTKKVVLKTKSSAATTLLAKKDGRLGPGSGLKAESRGSDSEEDDRPFGDIAAARPSTASVASSATPTPTQPAKKKMTAKAKAAGLSGTATPPPGKATATTTTTITTPSKVTGATTGTSTPVKLTPVPPRVTPTPSSRAGGMSTGATSSPSGRGTPTPTPTPAAKQAVGNGKGSATTAAASAGAGPPTKKIKVMGPSLGATNNGKVLAGAGPGTGGVKKDKNKLDKALGGGAAAGTVKKGGEGKPKPAFNNAPVLAATVGATTTAQSTPIKREPDGDSVSSGNLSSPP